MEFSDKQKAAIYGRSKKILVSAAAGAGKTAVLVERVFQRIMDPNEECSITDLLIVTFTKAAAAEMRSRIQKRISKALEEDPQNRKLREQINLIHQAKITTIHSFCLSLLRENFHELKLRPDFRLADDGENELMLAEAVDHLLEEEYRQNTPDFSALLDAVTTEKNDQKLRDMLITAYHWAESEPDRQGYSERLTVPFVGDPGSSPWGKVHLRRIARDMALKLDVYREIMGLVGELEYPEKIRPILDDEMARITAVYDTAAAGDWSACRSALEYDLSGGKQLRFEKSETSEARERIKVLREKARKNRTNYGKNILMEDPERLIDNMAATDLLQREFYRLVLELDKYFCEIKREQNVLNFSDLEHLALRLLGEKNSAGVFEPTTLAREKSAQLREVMVDEYQDTNGLQDMIFQMLTCHCSFFTVGDVKQAIYQFRRADPTIFLRRRGSYGSLPAGQIPDAAMDSCTLLLSDNYRSGPDVLNSVNFLFRELMCEDLGGMAYTAEEELYYQRDDKRKPSDDYITELDVLDLHLTEAQNGESDSDEDNASDESLTAIELEAMHIANRIRGMVEGGFLIGEKKGDKEWTKRPCRYGDFAVLMRSIKNRADILSRILRENGIPADADRGDEFFDTAEIAAAADLLRAVDNPTDDLDLMGCMASPLIGFTFDQLARIRAGRKDLPFLTAIRQCAEEDTELGHRADAFCRWLRRMRGAIADRTAGEAVAYLLDETGASAVFSAMEGGDGRRANLRRLLAMAQSYDGRGSFSDFVQYLNRMEERGKPQKQTAQNSGESVHVMTIHSSKGLEFPIVFLCGLTKAFNMGTQDTISMHSELGIGLKARNLQELSESTTLRREAIREKLKEEQLSEELRILYVGMTRAREKLVLIAAHNDADKELAQIRERVPGELAAYCHKHTNYAAWIEAVALSSDQSAIKVNTYPCPASTNTAPTQSCEAAADPALTEEIRQRLCYEYPYASASKLPVKLTATLYKRLIAEEFGEKVVETPAVTHRAAPKKPKFLTGIRALTPAERGTATHLAMQLLPIRDYADEDDVAAGIAELRERGQLTAAQAEAIRCGDILRFYRSPTGRAILRTPAERIRREFKFSLMVDAAKYCRDIAPGAEELMVQGVVDLYYENDDGQLCIVDFKTDAVTPATSPARAAGYAPQLEIYGDALAKITGKQVAEKQLFFFATGELMNV